MQKHLVLNCSRRSVLIILAAIASLFLLIGCASLFRSAGLTDQQAADQTAQLQKAIGLATSEAIETIQYGLSEGHDLKSTALTAGSALVWKLATIAASTIGTILTGYLAKLLNTERKLTNVLITGIEKSPNDTAKTTVHDKAVKAGIEPKLAARVQALT